MVGPRTCKEFLSMYYRLNDCIEILEIIERNNPEEMAKIPKNLMQFDKEILIKNLKEKIESKNDTVIMY